MNYYIEALKKYVDFEGRASRKEFWIFMLVNCIILILLGVASIFFLIETPRLGLFVVIAFFLYGLFIIIPTYAVTVRRLHDTNRSGWWILIKFIPSIGVIVLIVFCAMASLPLENEYGPVQKLVRAIKRM